MKGAMQGHFSSLVNKTKQAVNAGLTKMEETVEKVRHHAANVNIPTSGLPGGLDILDDAAGNLPVDMPPKIEINGETYKITKLLGEGGFSFVFVVKNINTGEDFALKRLLIQDPSQGIQARKEIEVMKKLNNHENVVKLIGVKEIQNGRANEIYILMELADTEVVSMMEERINSGEKKFSEQEILKIFFDVCKGVAHMHSQNPPMIHRDLKVENILCKDGVYKICDFGSTTTRVYTLTSRSEKQEAEEDIQKNTTLAYRSPEMADLYSGDPINEKSDVWALGCVLYKLCFFKGPFEDAESSIAVINGKYKIPPSSYSPALIDLIKSMLVVSVKDRPSVFDITERVGKLLGKEVALQRPVQQSRPPVQSSSQQVSKSSPSVSHVTNNAGGDLFSQLDWFDNGGQQATSPQPQQQTFSVQRKAPSSSVVVKKPQPAQINSFEDNGDWADFSDFENTTPSSATPKPLPKVENTQPKSTPKPLPPIETKQQNADLFSQLDWQDSNDAFSSQQQTNVVSTPQKPPVLRQPSTPVIQPTVQNLQVQTQHKRSLSESLQGMTLSTPSPQPSSSSSPMPVMAFTSESRRLTVSRATTIAPRQPRPSQISLACFDLYTNGDENLFVEYLVYIRERPVFVDQHACVKALILIHHIIQSALTDKCDPIDAKSLLQDIKEVWKPKNQLIAKFIVEYASWLERRCEILSALRNSVSANFSLKGEIQIAEISDLLDLLDGLMQVQKAILGDKTPSPKMGGIIPVASDAYDLYLCVTNTLQKCSEANKFSEDVKKVTLKYNQVYTNLTRFISQLGQFKLQAGNVRSIPTLPPTPPSFFGLQKTLVQPPSALSAPSVLNPNFEYNEPDEPYTYKNLTITNEPLTNADILKKDGNNLCADCTSNQVQWAHLGYGIVVCTQCRLAHFNLKTGRLESLTLNNVKLSREQLSFLNAVGNKTANEYFEIGLPPNTKPTNNINQPNLQTYVRNKYINKIYVRVGGASSPNHIRSPSGGLDQLNPSQFYM
ncbi:hypothetical protein FDP41_002427 [Naegleria fowleri]|uniref:non-specific serine/threonine protein kinase n=1 Tax=Naegleria fowleri TaxID=5763 RepID=A0A6A5BNH3_NAEFO|nr:uncharacterized protein FDP41_002427 [Naegleria fowleri]KAF0978607.1 hypothetical protein FDP41_002427 [Naegleria fowleri]